jgi:hypothetical protein
MEASTAGCTACLICRDATMPDSHGDSKMKRWPWFYSSSFFWYDTDALSPRFPFEFSACMHEYSVVGHAYEGSSLVPMHGAVRPSQHGTWNEQTKASLASGATEAQRLDCSTCSTKFIESGVGVQFRFSCAEQKELNRKYTRLALQGSTYTICSSISISVSCMPVFWDFFYQGIFMYDGNKKNRDWNLCPPTNKVIRRVKQPKIVTEIYVLQRIKLSIANKNIYKNT